MDGWSCPSFPDAPLFRLSLLSSGALLYQPYLSYRRCQTDVRSWNLLWGGWLSCPPYPVLPDGQPSRWPHLPQFAYALAFGRSGHRLQHHLMPPQSHRPVLFQVLSDQLPVRPDG